MFYSLLLEKVDRLNNDYSDSGSETMHNGHHEYVHEKVTSNNRNTVVLTMTIASF